MTVSMTPSLRPTAFDTAVLAACFAGWVPRAAFDACLVMRAHGMADAEIERAFVDAARFLHRRRVRAVHDPVLARNAGA